ncbi:MAG: phosphate ABC transporter, permease protein PstA [Pelagibacteraceae bacterium]|nr:phosphate ABC transporter, permease protein PstA [Pelagibacteraceae bacterium]PPR33013.1 MAG: Phosphate transport system permease protein PstA [Alphaproteobacteria bacterium MarineAlpha6_Bin5]|tara:strand:- start:357 stop:1643 length:1287 start_codon:yes stop_codon:yes gene_type:complete
MSSLTINDVVQPISSKRRNKEKLFEIYGIVAILFAISMLLILFASIFSKGYSAFFQTRIILDIELQEQVVDPDGARNIDVIRGANYTKLINNSLYDIMDIDSSHPKAKEISSISTYNNMLLIRDYVVSNPDQIGTIKKFNLIASDDVDQYIKGNITVTGISENNRKISNFQVDAIKKLESNGNVLKVFNKTFFTKSDSREPEVSGILGALLGSFYCLLVALFVAVPLGVFSAIYLQEFAKKNKFTDFIEININNLAAVPSIVFGLLGLSVFINFFHLPRSAPLVGGLVLALMSLPTIVIVTRASLLAVPDSIRDGAMALGASKMQAIFNQVLPLATPGICTGVIISLARALGETAPLLMIGMIAFIPDIPTSITDPSTALPAQIFMWADHPERAFVERTSAAILILLSFLIVMNSAAIYIRYKFEKKW